MAVRILHVVAYMDRGGLETMIMNCYRHIDRNAVQFDFLVHRSFRAAFDDEIEAMGGIIYRIPRLNPFSPSYKKALLDFFRSHPEYRIVHSHIDCMSSIPLAAAQKCGIPVRIAHSHNSNQDKDWRYPIKMFYMKKIPRIATDLFACSESAGTFMFSGSPFTVIRNGIETEKFAFDQTLRDEVRRELGLKNCLTLGHVGRFMPQKNHGFLLEIFAAVRRRNPDSVLLLVGEGPYEEQVREKVKSMGLTDNVRFLGVRSDVERILQAMDVFVMPSLYEGLSIATVEAQTSGAYCVFSDGISEACKLTERVVFLPLDNNCEKWADIIIAGAAFERRDQSQQVACGGFDIQSTADYLQERYLGMW